jgi:uncharacterized protein
MACPGIVNNVTSFGAFVDIGVHHDGLVHVSQLGAKNGKDPETALKPGDRVEVRVLKVDLEKKQISLTMRPPAPRKPPAKPRPATRPEPRPARAAALAAAPASEVRPPRAERPHRPAAHGDRPRPPAGPPPAEPPRPQRPAEDRRPPARPAAERRPESRRPAFNNPFAVLAGLKVATKKDKG